MDILNDVLENFHVADFYKVLRISNNSDQQEIKKAYFSRSLELHPDKITDLDKKDEYKKKFQILSEIYRILSNRETKTDYDRQLVHSCGTCIESDACDEIPITWCQRGNSFYSYDCRCSGSFVLEESYLSQADSANAFIIDCDSCSNSVKIVLQ